MDSDWILIFKMKQGSQPEQERFVRKYYGDILKYCFFHARDRSLAEDLTQEVFLRFFASLPRYRHRGKAKNYLYTIAANLCKDQGAANCHFSLDEMPELPCDPSEELEERWILEQAVQNLPRELREVVTAHYDQGLKLSETAAVLNISLPLVKYRLKRAKELLRKELGDGSE